MASCIKKTRRFLSVVKALISRGLFLLHGLICIWRVTVVRRNAIWWSLSGTLPLMIIETIYTLSKKKGGEWKWICPSAVLYLATAVPAIWFLELDLMDQRLVIGMRRPPMVNASQEIFVLDGQMIQFKISLGSEEWCKILEQMLLLVLIVGRWLLPKGEITREQLSQLLLVYIGMAADIIELFEAFKEKTVRENMHLTIVILSLWTASLAQFTLVVTATKSKKTRPGIDRSDSTSTMACCPTEVISILISVFLQDAPFLVLRMLLIFRYDVLSYSNIFFTAKNTLVLTLQIYRLVVLFTDTSQPPELTAADIVRIQSSSDTLDDLYRSSGSFSGSSMSDTSTESEKKYRKRPGQRRENLRRQITVDSAKTMSSSMDGADTTHSLDNDIQPKKSKACKHKRKASVVAKATRNDSDSSSLRSPNKTKEKSPGKKVKKSGDLKDVVEDVQNEKVPSSPVEKESGKKEGKNEKTRKGDKQNSADGEVKKKVKKFEKQSDGTRHRQRMSDSEDSILGVCQDKAENESPDMGQKKTKQQTRLKADARDTTKRSPKTDSKQRRHRHHHENSDDEEREQGKLQAPRQDHWNSVKDLRTALAFLNESGKYKTVVLKTVEDGQGVYVVDEDANDDSE